MRVAVGLGWLSPRRCRGCAALRLSSVRILSLRQRRSLSSRCVVGMGACRQQIADYRQGMKETGALIAGVLLVSP